MGAEKEEPKERLTKVGFGMSTAQSAGATVSTDYATSAGQSMEQLWNPIQIARFGDKATPGFEDVIAGGSEGGTFGLGQFVGPTILELNPYFTNMLDSGNRFSPTGVDGEGDPVDAEGEPAQGYNEFFHQNDYVMMVNEFKDGTTNDLNTKKLDKPKRDVTKVRVNAHRMPMILSGWGFDLGDRPTPRKGASFPDIFKLETCTPFDRTCWKTGPLAVQWDDERQVWAGGPQIVCGIALSEVTAPSNPCDPTYFTVQLFRKTTDKFATGTDSAPDPENASSADSDGTENPVKEWSPDDETITTMLDNHSVKNEETGEVTEFQDRIKVANRDPSLSQAYVKNAMFVIAIRLNYEWLPLWVGCPEDNIPDEDVPCIIQPKEKEPVDGGAPPTDDFEPVID